MHGIWLLIVILHYKCKQIYDQQWSYLSFGTQAVISCLSLQRNISTYKILLIEFLSILNLN